MTTDPWLQAEGLTRQVQGRPVLDGLEVALNCGELVLLSGANGVGKTTLLKVLAGLWPAETGHFRIDGELPGRRRRTLRWLRRATVYLHQAPYLFHGTVAANVAYGLRRGPRRPTRREAAAQTERALATVGLAGFGPRRVHQLSGGERQRVALARAWVLQPRLLLMDEPFASMDAHAREVAVRLVEDLPGAGCTVILTTHNPAECPASHHRHLRLAEGRLQPQITPKNGEPAARPERPALRVIQGNGPQRVAP